MNYNDKVLGTKNNPSQKPPKLFAFLASGVTVLVIIFSQFLQRGDNPCLRGIGVCILLLAGIFIFLPFYTLTKQGDTEAKETYMQSKKVVDQGLYAITRHPQYLGYIFLASGFALLSGHWVPALTALIGILFFNFQAILEEKYCLAQFGEVYAAYLQRVPRFNFILGIWRILQGAGNG